ncbi:hypothetical protein DXG01_003974 [Tephrocybe rancida]|nr:hypothetical protein DXG01_003974 [Tephrocybe rancida]
MAQVQRLWDRLALVPDATQAVNQALQKLNLSFAFTGNAAETAYGEPQHLPLEVRPYLLTPLIPLMHTQIIKVLIFSPVPSILDLEEAVSQTDRARLRYPGLAAMLQYIDHTPAVKYWDMNNIDIVLQPTSGRKPYFNMINGLPLVPYTVLLLEELSSWDRLRDSTAYIHIEWRRESEERILHMLSVLRRRQDIFQGPEFDTLLQEMSAEPATRFCAAHPDSRRVWERLGLMPCQDRAEDPMRDSSTTSTATAISEMLTALVRLAVTAAAAAFAQEMSRLQIRRLAARMTVEILKAHGFPCALFGSMACKLYGLKRIPIDIDILVLPVPDQKLNDESPTQESLKDLLVISAPDFFVLRPSRNPEATYRVLYFRPIQTGRFPQLLKVDILLPGVMHLPALHPNDLVWRYNNILPYKSRPPEPLMPVIPFSVLLLQKLQAWNSRRAAQEPHHRKKAPVDVRDLEWMLDIGGPKHLLVWGAAVWRDRRLFDEEFERLSRERVCAFCVAYPQWTEVWKYLGFDVPQRVGSA